MFSKLKQLSKDTAIYGISTMMGRFLTFLLVPFYTNIFPPSEYGIITNLYAFVALMNIIFIYGMDAAYLKYAGGNDEAKDTYSTPYISVAAVGIVLSLMIYLIRTPIVEVLGIPDSSRYLINYIPVILFIDAISAIPFIKLRLERKAKTFAYLKVFNIIVNVILNLILILKFKWGIEAVFVSNLAASAVTYLMLLPSVIKNLKLIFNFEFLKQLLKFGLPYLPAGLSMMLIQVINRPILESLTDLKTLGIYQANYKLGIFMMLFVNMFQYAWQPFFLQESKEENAKEIFSKVLTYFTLTAATILIILTFLIEDIVQFPVFGKTLIGSDYWGGIHIVPIILLAYLFNGLYVVFTAGIYIKEKSNYVPLVTGVSAALNIAANFLLIPILGITGAALATLLSYFVMAAGFFIVTQKFYHIKYEFIKMLKIFFVILISGIVYYSFGTGDIDFLLKIVICLAALIILYLLVLDSKEINFIRSRFIKK